MPLDVLLTGLLAAAGLLLVIGAQNAYVLRLGLSAPTRVVTGVVLFCAVSDTVLYAVGTAGIGAVASLAPWLLTLFRVVAVCFLIAYGALSARRAWRTQTLEAAASTVPRVGPALATVAAFTWLNPHVYLDTCVMVGSLANQFEADRWAFALGAALASWLWFCALGFGARVLRPVFSRPWTWRVLDAVIAVVMFAIAAVLLAEMIRGG